MSKPSILVIEDIPNDIKSITNLLENDYELTIVSSLQEATQNYKKNYLKTRIVLINININVTNTHKPTQGLQLLKELYAISIVPEFIMLSDYENLNEAVSCMKEGAYDYILKPFEPEALKYTIENTLENFDILKKIEESSKKNYIENINEIDIDTRIEIVREIVKKRRSQGRTLNAEDLGKLFFAKEPYQQSQQLLEASTKEEKSHTLSHANILIIEDDSLVREYLVDLLEENYNIMSAEDGQSAEKILEEKPDLDIILLDFYLPDTTGLKLLTPIKKHVPQAQTIIMTAYQETNIAIQTLRAGATDYLNKPFLETDLSTTIAKALQKKDFQTVFPEVRKKYLGCNASHKDKINLLNDLCHNREQQDLDIYMGDIYSFFPEFRAKNIPDEIKLPSNITQNIDKFIRKLKTTST